MTRKQHGRQYDMVVFGATGYTGKLTAEHIVEHLPTDLKWAVAGRTESKLRALADHCKKLNPDRLPPAIEIASVDNDEQLRSLVKKTFVLLTCVGPYATYGEYAFKACAETGTHYLDVTGESPWTGRMVKKYDAVAKASGAIMIPQIGIDSAPADLCAWVLAKCLRQQLGAKTKDTYICIHELNSAPSGGTLASAIGYFDNFSLREVAEVTTPFSWSPVPHDEPKVPPVPILSKLFGLRTIKNLGLMTTSITSTLDLPIIGRSWGLLSQIPSRKDEFYGPRFTCLEYFRARGPLHGLGMHFGLLLSGILLTMLPPLRWVARRLVTPPGEGPEVGGNKDEEIEYRGIANPDTEVPTGKQAFCRAWFRGSMYYLTGLFLSQATMTLLEDDLGLDGGVYTPACLGQGFVDRSNEAGFHMEVKLLDV